MNKWQINLNILHINIQIWQDNIRSYNIIIEQVMAVMAEICHHMKAFNSQKEI